MVSGGRGAHVFDFSLGFICSSLQVELGSGPGTGRINQMPKEPKHSTGNRRESSRRWQWGVKSALGSCFLLISMGMTRGGDDGGRVKKE